ncbi:MAG: hypothetical protein EA364_14540 [Balneolaceae bacterium]|nr:MAG: hypothetical protein EA364_14540 [Balneolaceae bacterium]
MIIYVDENIPPVFAEGFQILQHPLLLKMNMSETVEVKSISNEFGRGAKDEDWIPKLGGTNACVITQDYDLRRIHHQRVLCEEHKLSMIYLRPPSKNGFSYWAMVELLVKHWPELLRIIDRHERPFSFKIMSRSSKPEAFE